MPDPVERNLRPAACVSCGEHACGVSCGEHALGVTGQGGGCRRRRL